MHQNRHLSVILSLLVAVSGSIECCCFTGPPPEDDPHEMHVIQQVSICILRIPKDTKASFFR